MEEVLEFLRSHPGWWGLAIIYAAAALEYLVPPLPADSVVLAGSLLVVAGAQPFATVFLVAVAGGATGALIHYGLGRWCSRPDGTLRGQRIFDRLLGPAALPKFFEVFRKYGMWVIALNRAFPGVRAVTFFAAGAARLPLWSVMLAGLVANLGWTALILTLGVQVGGSWEKIEEVFAVYQKGLYAVAVSGAVVYGLYRWWKRKRASG